MKLTSNQLYNTLKSDKYTKAIPEAVRKGIWDPTICKFNGLKKKKFKEAWSNIIRKMAKYVIKQRKQKKKRLRQNNQF